MTIDAHQPFGKYKAAEFNRIGEPMKAMRRDFLPGDLPPGPAAAGLDGVVDAQARQILEETRWSRLVAAWIQALSPEEQARTPGGAAIEAY